SSLAKNPTTRPAKREAFTNIPQRQHRRVTSRSSEVASDREEGAGGRPASCVKTSKPSTANPRKRSTKPEQLARSLDKENTPSPPRAASPVFTDQPRIAGVATPVRARTLVGHLLGERDDMLVPPSPASSSDLSPVAQDIMNNLRKQRMRARQVERRRGIWVRD
ncbi:hypothetical protein BD414DRAFT_377858, partial [Trametes punicea]